ncbi:MAG TPA: hypothetical protein VHT04_12610 [Stellaceae bacterium]|nr:hypothetical protein [Stellaceae bacterium]
MAEEKRAEQIVFPGAIDWTGENPGMYLKESGDGPFVTLVSFFRVMLSPHGGGHAVVVLQDPQAKAASTGNFCLTDNETLARWLVAGYVANFAVFRDLPALAALSYRKLTSCAREGDATAHYGEIISGDGVELRLSWEGIGEAFALQLPPDKSATGKHRMLSVFAGARDGVATLNGKRLPGHAVPRDMAERQITTAFLAFAESWIRA